MPPLSRAAHLVIDIALALLTAAGVVVGIVPDPTIQEEHRSEGRRAG